MILLLLIPLGLLCLTLAFLCWRVKKKTHALALTLVGAGSLSIAGIIAYWSHVLIQEIIPQF